MTYTFDYQVLNNPLINTDSVVDLCYESAKQVYGPKNIELLKNPSMAGEDFAEYLHEVKGAFIYVGTSSNEKTSYPWHHEKFDLDETALPKGAEILANTAKLFLNK
jgi:amidohydrolase